MKMHCQKTLKEYSNYLKYANIIYNSENSTFEVENVFKIFCQIREN